MGGGVGVGVDRVVDVGWLSFRTLWQGLGWVGLGWVRVGWGQTWPFKKKQNEKSNDDKSLFSRRNFEFFVFSLAQGNTKRRRDNRKVNGLHSRSVHHVLYYGSNQQRNKFRIHENPQRPSSQWDLLHILAASFQEDFLNVFNVLVVVDSTIMEKKKYC